MKTSTCSKLLAGLVFLSFPLLSSTAAEIQEDVYFEYKYGVDVDASSGPMMRGAGGVDQRHRRMTSFFWGNLLFELGVCQADGCNATHHGPLHLCGCPHCPCPHHGPIPHFCKSICNSTWSSSTSSGNGGDGESENSNQDVSNDQNGQNRNGQESSSRFNWLYYFAGAALVSAAVGTVVMRKRSKSGAQAKSMSGGDEAPSSDFALMGAATAACGGILARMGLDTDDCDMSTASEEEDDEGIVSRRMNLLQNGGDVVPLDGGEKPSFVEIPHEMGMEEASPADNNGFEVEGPYRPSSQYAI